MAHSCFFYAEVDCFSLLLNDSSFGEYATIIVKHPLIEGCLALFQILMPMSKAPRRF